MYRYFGVGFLSVAFLIASCGSESDQELNIVDINDLACSTSADCAAKTVPSCCGDQMETSLVCVNTAFTPPESVDCSGNNACATLQAFDHCTCAPYSGDTKDAPDKICVGVQSDAGSDDAGNQTTKIP